MLRRVDLQRANSRRYLNPELEVSWSAAELRDHYLKKLRAMGYRFVQKRGPSGWRLKRFTVTYRRVIYLGVGWSVMSDHGQAQLLAHEYVHALQWRHERAFGLRYAFDQRFRWAMETQAYRESVRAYRATGFGSTSVRRYADRVADSYARGYLVVGQKLKAGILREMPAIMLTP
jgi:hypothetical protein